MRLRNLLVLELWGLGDLALAVPFLRTAARETKVTLVAKPDWAPVVARFCPGVALVPLRAPWTAFRHKYQLHRWPWKTLGVLISGLRKSRYSVAVSARRDPRDHVLMRLSQADRRIGYSRAGSALLLTDALPRPAVPHRAEYWRGLATALGWEIAAPAPPPRSGRRVVIHTGAGKPARQWPRERFEEIARRLRARGWEAAVVDESLGDLDALWAAMSAADRFIGNDSGPGHVAALCGVPTFTIFGPQLPGLFAPIHPQAAWIEGRPCPFKPCRDYCRFPVPHCIHSITVDEVWAKLDEWLGPP